MPLFEIKSWLDGKLLFSLETSSLKLCLEAAVKARADLTGADLTRAYLTRAYLTRAHLARAYLTDADLRDADLTGADLTGADLTGAYLTRAKLTHAKLTGADLTDADLTDAYLTDAYLTHADLTRANLTRAKLTGADLTDADLTGADLTGAYVTGADLTDAYLTPIRDDFWAVLSAAPREVAALREAIVGGRIEGSSYEGECACLVGTIAKARHTDMDSLGCLKPNSQRPAEVFFLAIKKGDTPETNAVSKLVLQWLDEWVQNISGAFVPVVTRA